MEQKQDVLDASAAEDWRAWLQEHHTTKQGVWLVFHKVKRPTLTYDEALDEALAFGWIDSVIRKIDDDRYVRKFTPRRAGSIWSKLNIERVERLRKQGRMTKWGTELFDRRTDKVSLLERVTAEGAAMPKDLDAALRKNKKAWANWEGMAPSHRKRYLIWLAGAKRPETRKRRIVEAVGLVAKNVRNLLK
jgi:uncharacterized protein YdeI (YjbR/CyaY-like superfamily)